MNSVGIILISAAIFFAFVVWLASDNDNLEKWTGLAFAAAIVGGLCIYGTINASNYKSEPFIAVLRTVVDLGKMFGNSGAEGYDKFMKAFEGVPGASAKLLTVFYWCVHFFAFYSMISAVIMLLGKTALKKLKTVLMRVHDIELIYGVDESTLGFGSRLSKDKDISIVYVGNGSISENEIRDIGGVWFADPDATEGTAAFVKRLGLKKGRGKLRLSALSGDADANISYALKLLESLKKRGVNPAQTELIILGTGESDGEGLQALGDTYGYGSVRMFDRAELVSRLLIKKYPICDEVSFDDNAKGRSDVEVLIVGFGNVGREVLRKAVANGQFCGSSFRATVFDPAIGKNDGFFRDRYASMFEEYDIDLKPFDGRSSELASFIRERSEKLSYIVVSVGNDKTGRQIVEEITNALGACGVSKPVYMCSSDKVTRFCGTAQPEVSHTFEADILFHGVMDELAVQINHFYNGDDGEPAEQWKSCDYFSRMSCRASADYLSGFLKKVGALKKHALSPEESENLGISEHKRWCAFHYSFGYSLMSEEEKKERAKLYSDENHIRIAKDTNRKHHACLIPWDDLDELSRWENGITGGNVDYKQLDRDNVETVRGLAEKLEAAEESTGDASKDKAGTNKKKDDPKRRKLRRYLPIIIAILIALIAGIVILVVSHLKRAEQRMVYPTGLDTEGMPTETAEAPNDISFDTARSMQGDKGSERFTPTDEEPPSCFPLAYNDEGLLKLLTIVLPATRDQGSYGTCWAHSAIALAEFSMIAQGEEINSVDYSELHLAYYTYNNGTGLAMGDTGDSVSFIPTEDDPNYLECGGTLRYAAMTLARRRGCIDEKYLPYDKADKLLKGSIKQDFEFGYDEAWLRNAIFIDIKKNPDHVKQAIMSNGAVGASIWAPVNAVDYMNNYNEETNSYYAAEAKTANHAVVVVGWDDDYPRENFSYGMFNKRPESNGAWLVRNSWSTETKFSLESYFWISYEDPSLKKFPVATFEMSPVSGKTENMYCYDTQTTYVGVQTTDKGTGARTKAANVFTVGGHGGADKELLKEVSFFAAGFKGNAGSDYEIKIYRHLPPDAGPVKDGELVKESTTKGKLYYDGYYTIELTEPVLLEKGEVFSVVVELSNASLAVEAVKNKNNGICFAPTIHKHESYYLYRDTEQDKKLWRDMYNEAVDGGFMIGNVIIGAITEDVN